MPSRSPAMHVLFDWHYLSQKAAPGICRAGTLLCNTKEVKRLVVDGGVFGARVRPHIDRAHPPYLELEGKHTGRWAWALPSKAFTAPLPPIFDDRSVNTRADERVTAKQAVRLLPTRGISGLSANSLELPRTRQGGWRLRQLALPPRSYRPAAARRRCSHPARPGQPGSPPTVPSQGWN